MKGLRQIVEAPARTIEDELMEKLAAGHKRVTVDNGERRATFLQPARGIVVVHDDSASLRAAQAKRERKAAKRRIER